MTQKQEYLQCHWTNVVHPTESHMWWCCNSLVSQFAKIQNFSLQAFEISLSAKIVSSSHLLSSKKQEQEHKTIIQNEQSTSKEEFSCQHASYFCALWSDQKHQIQQPDIGRRNVNTTKQRDWSIQTIQKVHPLSMNCTQDSTRIHCALQQSQAALTQTLTALPWANTMIISTRLMWTSLSSFMC